MKPNIALAAILAEVVEPPHGTPSDSKFKKPPTIGISFELHIKVSVILIGSLFVSMKAKAPNVNSSGTFISSPSLILSPLK